MAFALDGRAAWVSRSLWRLVLEKCLFSQSSSKSNLRKTFAPVVLVPSVLRPAHFVCSRLLGLSRDLVREEIDQRNASQFV